MEAQSQPGFERAWGLGLMTLAAVLHQIQQRQVCPDLVTVYCNADRWGVAVQGGEEAEALMSQLEAQPAGDMEWTWNIKVRRQLPDLCLSGKKRQEAARQTGSAKDAAMCITFFGTRQLVNDDIAECSPMLTWWFEVVFFEYPQEFLPPAVQQPFQAAVSEFLLLPWREVVAPTAANPVAGSQVPPSLCWLP